VFLHFSSTVSSFNSTCCLPSCAQCPLHVIAAALSSVQCCPVGVKLATFDTAKTMLGHANKAYDEEVVKCQRGERVKDSSSGLI